MPKILLDTNIIIHREARTVVRRDIGILFNWLDRLNYQKCIHPLTLDEIRQHKDASLVATFETKLDSYYTLKTQAPESPEIQQMRAMFDKDQNDFIDSSLLKELFHQRVDFLITEDRKIHKKADYLGITERVFKIDTFLEKALAENPDLADYKVLSVKKEHFSNININDPFFDTFKRDYPGFDVWFNKKADEIAYICKAENNDILAFLYLKVETPDENYVDIEPIFRPRRRLKIGTFKVIVNGYKLGERFLKIVFDNAMLFLVDEIYVTIFDRTQEQKRLIGLMQDWGFEAHGVKHSKTGDEQVFTRDFQPQADVNHPNLTYPYFSRQARKFIVPIYPKYHTELFPDSILRTESPNNFVENRPNRNAISKVYVCRSIERNLNPGDVIAFYRTAADGQSAYYSAVITTIGIVQNVYTEISGLNQFIELCRKRSVFSDAELAEHWNWKPRNRPFIVNFLYTLTFTEGNRLNRKALLELNIISSEPPRGFVQISDQAFQTLMEKSNANQRFIVD